MHSSIYFEIGHQNSIPMRYKLVQWDATTNRWCLILFDQLHFNPPIMITHPQVWIISRHHLQVFHLTRAQQKYHRQQLPKVRGRWASASPGRPYIGHCRRQPHRWNRRHTPSHPYNPKMKGIPLQPVGWGPGVCLHRYVPGLCWKDLSNLVFYWYHVLIYTVYPYNSRGCIYCVWCLDVNLWMYQSHVHTHVRSVAVCRS